jgi:hypothetical protein
MPPDAVTGRLLAGVGRLAGAEAAGVERLLGEASPADAVTGAATGAERLAGAGGEASLTEGLSLGCCWG